MNRRIGMATLLLKGEWLLDDAAYRLGGDRFTPDECRDTARALEELAVRCTATPARASSGLQGPIPGANSTNAVRSGPRSIHSRRRCAVNGQW